MRRYWLATFGTPVIASSSCASRFAPGGRRTEVAPERAWLARAEPQHLAPRLAQVEILGAERGSGADRGAEPGADRHHHSAAITPWMVTPPCMFCLAWVSTSCGYGPRLGEVMGATDQRDRDSQAREGRLNRRVSMTGIVVNGATVIAAAFIAALATAHSTTIITVLGGKSAKTATVPASPPVSSVGPRTSDPHQVTVQLPSGLAFTQGGFTITSSGIDLDRNPPESGSLPNTHRDIIAEYPASLYFYDAQETVQWQQENVPTQAECHHDELSNGQADLQLDLTSFQQTGRVARFCVLTAEGRDAYIAIPGSKIISSSPLPGQGFVWPAKLPLN
jgi:hypothetical protein